MGNTRAVNKHKDRFDVYIGRGSKWGNPFIIGPDGTRQDVVDKYRQWITTGDGMHLLQDLWELKDKALGCFCSPKACHGDVLVELVEKL